MSVVLILGDVLSFSSEKRCLSGSVAFSLHASAGISSEVVGFYGGVLFERAVSEQFGWNFPTPSPQH
jgi:hypothetical protein